jgi:hypothetical protein
MQYGYWKTRVIQKHKIPASIRHLVPGMFVLFLIALPPLGVLWTAALWLWLAMVGTYTSLNLAASVATAARNGFRLLPLLPAVFAAYHVGYGYGFLRGVWDLVIRRKAGTTFVTLTRSSTQDRGVEHGN